jgi:hypothetical protein
MSDKSDIERFIGSWRLVRTTNDGAVIPERGASPTGIITYDASGWMTAQIQPDRPPVPMAGDKPTGEEALQALNGYTAYFGPFSVDDVKKIVTHHREASVQPGWEHARDFVRAYEFSGKLLILRPVGTRNEVVWERMS